MAARSRLGIRAKLFFAFAAVSGTTVIAGFAAWLMLFVIFIRELGATILLYAQGTETISVALVVLSERSFGYVAALAVIQLLLLLMAFSLFRATRASLIQA